MSAEEKDLSETLFLTIFNPSKRKLGLNNKEKPEKGLNAISGIKMKDFDGDMSVAKFVNASTIVEGSGSSGYAGIVARKNFFVTLTNSYYAAHLLQIFLYDQVKDSIGYVLYNKSVKDNDVSYKDVVSSSDSAKITLVIMVYSSLNAQSYIKDSLFSVKTGSFLCIIAFDPISTMSSLSPATKIRAITHEKGRGEGANSYKQRL